MAEYKTKYQIQFLYDDGTSTFEKLQNDFQNGVIEPFVTNLMDAGCAGVTYDKKGDKFVIRGRCGDNDIEIPVLLAVVSGIPKVAADLMVNGHEAKSTDVYKIDMVTDLGAMVFTVPDRFISELGLFIDHLEEILDGAGATQATAKPDFTNVFGPGGDPHVATLSFVRDGRMVHFAHDAAKLAPLPDDALDYDSTKADVNALKDFPTYEKEFAIAELAGEIIDLMPDQIKKADPKVSVVNMKTGDIDVVWP